jgi:radical SAM protein with 4Fe4S-binding SPASM domain
MDQNNRCNLKCLMCGFNDPRVTALQKYDMPRPLYDSIAAQIFPRTSFLVLSILTEPFMTRDFPDRLEAVRRFGVPYSEIITNGTLLDERATEKLLDAAITCLTVSIGGAPKQVYESIRIHANGDVYPCMAWTRSAAGNLLRQSFDEIWNGPDFAALRREFEEMRPGMDCLHCRIRRDFDADPDDDFFYRKVAKPLPGTDAPARLV